jgi:LEA14-like dessication related protein
MKKTFFYLLIFFSLTITSCRELKEVSFKGVESVKLKSISQKGLEALIAVTIKNDNKIPFKVHKSGLDVTVNGINLGKVFISEKIKINANSEKTYTFTLKSDFSNLNVSLPQLLSIASSKSLKVSIKGELKGGAFFVKRSYPIDITQTVPFGKM